MTVTSDFLRLPLLLLTFFFTACNTPAQKRTVIYSVQGQLSSKQYKDCSLTVLTQANHRAEALSESSGTKCGIMVKINKVDGNTFLMSLKIKMKQDNLSHEFKSKIKGSFGKPITLEQQASNSEALRYTFLIEEAQSL